MDVVPLLRMPTTHRGIFTYRVPIELAPRVQRGAFVRVPFRKKSLWGICVAAPSQLGPIPVPRDVADVRSDAQLTDDELDALTITAAHYRVSLATVARTIFPTPPLTAAHPGSSTQSPRSQHSHILENVRMSSPGLRAGAVAPRGDTVVIPQTRGERLAAIAGFARRILADGKTVLLCTPYRAWVERLRAALSPLPCVLLDHAIGKQASWAAYVRARSSPCVVLATRGGATFAPPSLGGIVLDLAHEDDHKSWDMQPKYDVRTMTERFARVRGIPRLICSPTPRLEEWTRAVRRVRLNTATRPVPTIVRLDEFWRGGGTGFLTDTLVEAAHRTLGEGRAVLVLHNRRGRLGRVSCSDCEHVERCATCAQPLVEHDDGLRCHTCETTIPTPAMCRACRSPYLQFRGIGTAGIARALAGMFPNAPLTRVDRDAPSPPPSRARIIVATERYTNSIAPLDDRDIGLVALIHAERYVRGDDFRGDERLLAALRDVAVWANTWGATLLLQTINDAHPALRAFLANDFTGWYRRELAERHALKFPPATRLVRCDIMDARGMSLGMALRRLLERDRSGTVLSVEGPYTFGVVRRKPVTSILVRLDPAADDRAIAAVTAVVSPEWSVDLDPLTLHA